jgi:hypothetical protein
MTRQLLKASVISLDDMIWKLHFLLVKLSFELRAKEPAKLAIIMAPMKLPNSCSVLEPDTGLR